jgi:hypothetical protein
LFLSFAYLVHSWSSIKIHFKLLASFSCNNTVSEFTSNTYVLQNVLLHMLQSLHMHWDDYTSMIMFLHLRIVQCILTGYSSCWCCRWRGYIRQHRLDESIVISNKSLASIERCLRFIGSLTQQFWLRHVLYLYLLEILLSSWHAKYSFALDRASFLLVILNSQTIGVWVSEWRLNSFMIS